MRPAFSIALLLSVAALTTGYDRSSARSPMQNPAKAEEAKSDTDISKLAPEVPVVTFANVKTLIKDADTPSLAFMFHGKNRRKVIDDQIVQFGVEAKKYAGRLAFLFIDLDTDEGEKIVQHLIKPHTDQLKSQLWEKPNSGYMFYFPGNNLVTLVTVGKPPEKEYVVNVLTADMLEAYVWREVSLKPKEVKPK